MTSMKDFKQVEVTGDADAVTSELHVENNIEKLVWFTIEENHTSFEYENNEKVIKIETDTFDDYTWKSTIEIIKNVDDQSNMELPLECQDVADNNIYLNHENTSDKIFHCNICGKSFVLNHLLKNHLAEHKRQVKYKTNNCKFCGKQFKLKFGLNKHIEKHHNSMYRCTFCKLFIHCSKYIEHKKSHERRVQTEDQTKCDMHECNVCDKTFNSVDLWTAHMTYHQQQIDLNISTVQFNLLESESNTFDTNNENIKFEPNVIQNSISIEDNNTDSATMSRNHKKETKSSSIIKTNFTKKHNQLLKHDEGINSTNKITGRPMKSVGKKNIMECICKICGRQYETNLALDNHIWEDHSADISTYYNKN